MLKLSHKQKERLNSLLNANNNRFALKPVLVTSSGGCNSCNGGCKAGCGGCSQGCGSTNTCALTLF